MRISSSGPSALLGACMLPVPSRGASAWQSRGRVNGSPGTTSIPAPYPAGVPEDYSHTALHKSPDAQPSWRPGIYYSPDLDAPPPVSVYSDNQMPVPAVDPVGKPYVAARPPHFLGQQQVGQPGNWPFYQWRS